VKIQQHLYSVEGCRRFKFIELISNEISKQDNVLLAHSRHTHVIWLNKRSYPMIFRNAQLRDVAFTYINDCIETYQEEIVMPLGMFYSDLLTDEQIKEEIQSKKYTFGKHIKSCAEYVMNYQKIHFNDLHNYEAFASLSKTKMKELRSCKLNNITNEQIRLFAETLRYPREFHSHISPLSFWTNLYELRPSSSNCNAASSPKHSNGGERHKLIY
jgi:hypothetical protein